MLRFPKSCLTMFGGLSHAKMLLPLNDTPCCQVPITNVAEPLSFVFPPARAKVRLP
jgi:hypothetical protein